MNFGIYYLLTYLLILPFCKVNSSRAKKLIKYIQVSKYISTNSCMKIYEKVQNRHNFTIKIRKLKENSPHT